MLLGHWPLAVSGLSSEQTDQIGSAMIKFYVGAITSCIFRTKFCNTCMAFAVFVHGGAES